MWLSNGHGPSEVPGASPLEDVGHSPSVDNASGNEIREVTSIREVVVFLSANDSSNHTVVAPMSEEVIHGNAATTPISEEVDPAVDGADRR
ncbi:hypothetical protein V6N12_001377 [Hibiscus sabdariffa]|uniref:Uncharacterized protein n=1 Tax=Hibiscus sabdariffa TaxID=183260 RepID=A0ABR2AWP9_9ROSI